jgi:hypothetical protein
MRKRERTVGAPQIAAPSLLSILLTAAPLQNHAETRTSDDCRLLAGTFVTSISDIEGVFSSRGLATFTADGIFLMTDSAQSGLPGIYQPFSSAQGAWQCLGAENGNILAVATGLNFVLPGEGLTTGFGRTDYRLSLDTETDVLSGTVELSFTAQGDLEAADPLTEPGPVLEKFALDGKRVVPKTRLEKTEEPTGAEDR